MDAADWPGQETALALVRRLPDDPAAHAEFLTAVYPPLLRDLQAARPGDDPDRIADVVTALLFAFVQAPGKYDPERSLLRTYLQMAANRDLLNARAKDSRRRAKEIPLEAVAEPAADGKEEEAEDVREWLDDPRVAAVVAGFDDVERAAWGLMLDGNRSTAAYAAVLGITHLPAAEQERKVKRAKERIKVRLKRAQGRKI